MNGDFDEQDAVEASLAIATLDQSKEDDFTQMLGDLEIRKFCLINAGTLVINTGGSSKSVSPHDTIKMARDFYLFLVSEDPVVDGDGFDQEYEGNVIQFKKPLLN